MIVDSSSEDFATTDDSDNKDKTELNVVEINLTSIERDWYVDSCALQHVTGESSQLTNVQRTKNETIKTADSKGHHVHST